MKKLNIHYFQHVSFENPGTILEWARERGHHVTCTKFYEKPVMPDISDLDWLIIMGGPMNIYEESEYPWLVEEKKFIRQAIDTGKTVIGICLGSQLLADSLGARVFKNKEKEIGWFDIEWSDAARETRILEGIEGRIKVFHWHGDTFNLPLQTTHLASSEGCNNQAFIYKEKVLGLQFHLETTEELMKGMLENGRAEISGGKYIQSEAAILDCKEMYNTNKMLLYNILDRL